MLMYGKDQYNIVKLKKERKKEIANKNCKLWLKKNCEHFETNMLEENEQICLNACSLFSCHWFLLPFFDGAIMF